MGNGAEGVVGEVPEVPPVESTGKAPSPEAESFLLMNA